jgi:hypothetical protein
MSYYKLEHNTLRKCGSVEEIAGRRVTDPIEWSYTDGE